MEHSRPRTLREKGWTVEDVNEHERTEERPDRSLEALIALHEVSRALGSALGVEEIGATLVETVQRVAACSAAVVSLMDEQGRQRALHSRGNEDLWRLASATPEARAARLAAFETKEAQHYCVEPFTGAGGLLGGLYLPLAVRDRLHGILEVCGSESLAEKMALETIVSMSKQAASALENARLHRELAEHKRFLEELTGRQLKAWEEERRRLACDMDDGLAQVAFAARQDLQSYAEVHSLESALHQEKLNRTLQSRQETVGEARRVITTLQPTVPRGVGVGAMLRSQIDLLQAEGWEITYAEALDVERLPSEIETALYWVAQEALTNVRKHAQTTRVDIALRCSGKRICLEVRDRGCGFSEEASQESRGRGEHIGLYGMQERITLLKGEFRIHSQPGMGTSIMAEIPLERGVTVTGGRMAGPTTKAPSARLLVADDHALIREGFRATLSSERDLEVVGEAADGEEAIELCRRLRPALVLMDMRIPRMDGLSAARAITDGITSTNILMISDHADADCLFKAIEAGAVGYITKDISRQELVNAVRSALEGKSPLNRELAMQLLRRLACGGDRTTEHVCGLERKPELVRETLTLRELEILTLVAQGLTNRQIGLKLVVSPATVKVHVEHILAKLGVSDRTQAAVRATEAGLLQGSAQALLSYGS